MAINPNLDPSRDINDLRDEVQGITTAFRDAVNNIADNIKKINQSHGIISDVTLKNIRTISYAIDRSYVNINANIGKAIKGEMKRKDISNEISKLEKLRNRTLSEISNLEKESLISNKKRSKELLSAAQVLKEQTQYIEDIIDLQKQELNQVDLFNKKLQPIAGILKGLGKIPILGNLLNTERGIEMATDAAQKGAGSFKIFGEGIKGAFSGFGKIFGKLGLIALVITSIVKLVKFFIEASLQADKQITSLAKNLSVSKNEAASLRNYFTSIKGSLETQYALTKEIVQAQLDLSNLSSANLLYSNQAIDAQISLTKQLGLSVDEAAELNKLFIVNNEINTEGIDAVYEQIAAYANQNKIIFNGSKILKEISKINGQILSTFKGNTRELTNAVLKANTLGINLEKARSVSSSLLDFQSSIENELEAELLLGKELNLERARAFALQGKYVEAGEDILKQVGDYNKFSRLNVIQQQAIAKAAGMTADELANALYQQQFLSTETKAQISRYRSAGMEAQAAALESGRLKGEELEKAQRSLSIQEKFNLAIERAKEVFSDMVSGGLLDRLSDILTNITIRLSALSTSTSSISNKGLESSKNISSSNAGAFEKNIAQKLGKSLAAYKEYGPNKFDRFTYSIFGGSTGRTDAESRIMSNILGRVESGEKIQNSEAYKKVLLEEINKEAYFQDPESRKKLLSKIGIKEETPQNDFVMKGNTLVPFRKDDIIMGGTNLLGGDGKEVVSLLREIATAIKEGGTVMLDGQKVGMALAKGSYRTP